MGALDYLLLAALGLWLAAALRGMRRKKGCCGCSGACAGCSGCGGARKPK